MSEHAHYDPKGKHWPIVGSIALFFLAIGIAGWLHQDGWAPYSFCLGGLILSYMIYGWFRDVIEENRTVFAHDAQNTNSFRWGMFWFIFTELMFFGAFFGALFYARIFSVPWLGGEGDGVMTHLLLWPNFQNVWPVFVPPDSVQFPGPRAAPYAWGVPALNTLALLASDISITWAYWACLNNRKVQLITGQFLGLILCLIFLVLQVHEYGLAYTELGLKLNSGIYASTFYMLTAVHGTHVVMGVIMLLVLMGRSFKGHFNSQNSFAIGAASWYWHFIDFLWLALFVFVYWL